MIVLCAVCEREIEEAASRVVEFQGERYPVCSDQCHRELLRNPEAYAEETGFERVY